MLARLTSYFIINFLKIYVVASLMHFWYSKSHENHDLQKSFIDIKAVGQLKRLKY